MNSQLILDERKMRTFITGYFWKGRLNGFQFLLIEWLTQEARGKSTVTVVPSTSLDAIVKLPWWDSTMRLTIGNPKPVPEDFVVKKGLVSLGKISGGIGEP